MKVISQCEREANNCFLKVLHQHTGISLYKASQTASSVFHFIKNVHLHFRVEHKTGKTLRDRSKVCFIICLLPVLLSQKDIGPRWLISESQARRKENRRVHKVWIKKKNNLLFVFIDVSEFVFWPKQTHNSNMWGNWNKKHPAVNSRDRL